MQLYKNKTPLIVLMLMFFTSMAWANLDDRLRLKRILLIPGYDDVNGAISKYLDSATEKSLVGNSRFELVKDASVVQALGTNSEAYPRVAQNQSVHKEALSLTKADATVLTHSRRVGKEIEISQEWRTSDGLLLFSETKTMPGGSPLPAQEELAQNLTHMNIAKIPFQGTITGRSGNTVTIDMSENMVSRGQKIEIARLISEKRHPLLNTLMDADYVNLGTVEITSVDGVVAFGTIIRENPTEKISKNNKVVGLKKIVENNNPSPRRYGIMQNQNSLKNQDDSYPTTNAPKADPRESEQSRSYFAAPQRENRSSGQQVATPSTGGAASAGSDELLMPDDAKMKPMYGKATAKVMWGQLSHQQTITNNIDVSGSGIGAAMFAEVWITRNWLGGLEFLYQSATLSGENGTDKSFEAGSTSWRKLNFFGGYRFLPDDRFDGINIIAAVGYQSVSFGLPNDATNDLSAKTYAGLLFRVGGEYPVIPKHRLEGAVEIVPFGGFEEEVSTGGTVDDATSIGIQVGWNFLYKENFNFNAMINYNTNTGNFQGGSSVTSNQWSITPGVTYLF